MSDTDDERPADDATVCPLCAVGCTLAPSDGEEGRARGVPGPVNRDGHLCQRGIGAFDALGSDDRLTTPLVRRDGELRAASWPEALDRAADALASVADGHDADALCFFGAPHCTNEENYLLQKLARTLGTNNVDNRARICHAAGMTALETRLGRPAMTNSLSGLSDADVLLVVGANPARQQPVAFDSYVRPALHDGTALVHVDPRENQTTRAASAHLAPRPGTDALVVTALCALAAERGGVDESFVAERTSGYGEYADSLADFDADRAAATADVPPEDLGAVADRIAAADRVAVLAGTGIEGGSDTADALLNLLLLTGNFGRSGTGMNVLRGLNNEQGATDAGCRPDRLPGHRPVDSPEDRAHVADEWGIDPPATPGLTERAAVERFGESVHGALVVGENPAVEKRDASWLRNRLTDLSALVVVDLFESETTDHADVVLPAAAGVEKAGTVTNLDRRVQSLAPAVAPPGDARPDFEILRELGTRLVGDAFEYEDSAAAFEEWTRLSPVHEGMTRSAVADGGVQWPTAGDGSSGTAVLYEEAFETESGRAAFADVETSIADAPADELTLLVGSRAGGVAAGPSDERVHLAEADAASRGIEDGETVVVRNDAAAVEATAAVGGSVREGTAYLHADVADPLVRDESATVRVRPASQ
ncbi:molybdopterin-dependent oxidoreductase [Halomicroarcula limicola]|uniref:Molybdopterin-dependent oxidoreductase n=1 Tax=Haloarcula limicola TaxID=1429915 RepID=A0A8J7YDC5_9EURY|nr:molybdopterin-dependent oxidoreductase [Halomicroarcula limicola]MBV0925834.1 molybdopterin-dependent oxidoreductase [Halomicroarcula limicola]